LSVALAPNTGEFLLQNVRSYGAYDRMGAVSQTYLLDSWYRVEVDWGATGLITAKLFASDGTTQLNSVTGMNDTVTSGGIAFRGFQNPFHIGGPKYFDTIQVDRPVEPPPVPEPGSVTLLLVGSLGLGTYGWMRRGSTGIGSITVSPANS
jgi:hypothetical protein